MAEQSSEEAAPVQLVLFRSECVAGASCHAHSFAQSGSVTRASGNSSTKARHRHGASAAERGPSLPAKGCPNRGGEDHAFTEVAAFGGGCVAPPNAIVGLSPVPECSVPGLFGTLVEEGDTLDVPAMAPAVHRFQCLIHPWMHTTMTVGCASTQERPRSPV
jgi:hypothetical protein